MWTTLSQFLSNLRPRFVFVSKASVLPLLFALVVGCGGVTTEPSKGEDVRQTSAAPVATTSADAPSRAAKMICDTPARQAVGVALALPGVPPATEDWADHVYTCTYALPGGSLVLRVKELADVPAAQRDFEEQRADLGPYEAITGLPSLGLPGFKTQDGNVVFVKDNMTLRVDATGLLAEVGRNRVSRGDFAYQVATNILGCWTGD